MGFPIPRLAFSRPGSRSRSYGKSPAGLKIGGWTAAVTILCAATLYAAAWASVGLVPARGAERAVNIVALGDSLVAGYGLPGNDAFPVRLQHALADKGVAARIVNAGVSGDTASGGLSRLDWSVPDGTEAVILELGANDALRGIDPAITRKALDAILRRLAERKIPVLLCGMLAPPNMGDEYVRAFNAIYPDLAARYDAILYPFFLTGVAADPKLNQRDGLHPTAAGVAVIVEGILPKVEQLIMRAKAPQRP
jgi:acyl-CoA thioesterase-1